MPIEQVGMFAGTGAYRLTTLPGFENTIFLARPNSDASFANAVYKAQAYHGVLQSAREGIAWRIEAYGSPFQWEADCSQVTRTISAHVYISGKYWAFFDDSPRDQSNVGLAHAVKGYESHMNKDSWLVSMKDRFLRRMLRRAEKADRIVELTEENPLKRSLVQEDGVSPYASDPINKAILLDVAEHNATYQVKRGYTNAPTFHLTPSQLNGMGVDKDHAEIRFVRLGGIGNIGDVRTYASSQFTKDGSVGAVRIIKPNKKP